MLMRSRPHEISINRVYFHVILHSRRRRLRARILGSEEDARKDLDCRL